MTDLKQIPMPTFIEYLHDYKTVNVKANSVSLGSYVVIALSTALFIHVGAVILFYYKCCKHRAWYGSGKRLADFCNDEMVGGVESAAAAGTNEVVSHKPGGRSSSIPGLKEEKLTFASLLQDTTL